MVKDQSPSFPEHYHFMGAATALGGAGLKTDYQAPPWVQPAKGFHTGQSTQQPALLLVYTHARAVGCMRAVTASRPRACSEEMVGPGLLDFSGSVLVTGLVFDPMVKAFCFCFFLNLSSSPWSFVAETHLLRFHYFLTNHCLSHWILDFSGCTL